jgi:hypothetical protein
MSVQPVEFARRRAAHHEQDPLARIAWQLVDHPAEHPSQLLAGRRALKVCDGHAASGLRSRDHARRQCDEQYNAGARRPRSGEIGPSQYRHSRPTSVGSASSLSSDSARSWRVAGIR